MGLFVALVAVLGALGCVEFYRLTQSIPGKDCRVWSLVVSLVFLIVFPLIFVSEAIAAGPLGEGFLPEVAGLVVVLLGAFTLRLRHQIEGPESVYPVGMAGFSFVYIPVLFSAFVMRLAALPVELASVKAGLWLVLLVVIATKFTDMGAYLVGSLIGKHKAIPHVSPAKSWEGYVGSMLFTQAGAFGIYWLARDDFGWMGSWVHVLVMGFLIGIAAMIGDLAESILKRSLKVKDSGHLLPGIGGVLDLLDSLCFAVPVAYFYLILFVL
jgi:phosphatidate cytidylyltransferase